MMNLKIVLLFIILSVNISHLRHLRKHKHKHSRKSQKLEGLELLGTKELRELKEKQNPWESGSHREGDSYFHKKARTAIADQSYRWHSKEIAYEVDSGFTTDQKDVIERALRVISNQTCIKPRVRTETDKESVLFVPEAGKSCYSWIGSHHVLQQKIYLDPYVGCVTEGTVKHEFLHVLGLFHEQAAPDRDQYVKIIWENIINGAEHNFEISQWPTTRFGLPYDYDSITHYSAYAFSKNGYPTMQSKTLGKRLTKHKDLSKIDIETVNKMYNCE